MLSEQEVNETVNEFLKKGAKKILRKYQNFPSKEALMKYLEGK